MGTFSKHSDIEAVMIRAQEGLSSIEAKYQDYLNKQQVPDDLLVDVKDCLANLRSALDYLWCKVPNAGTGAHFPIGNSNADFVNKVKGIDQRYIDTVGEWQSYNGEPWLSNFGYIRNKYEHLTLIPQTRQETKRVSVSRGGTSVSWGEEGVTFGGGVAVMGVPIDPVTQLPVPNNVVETNIEIWVSFLFDGSSISPDFPSGISVLPFLKQSVEKVRAIISEVESI